MESKCFNELIKSESSARKYLLQFCWKNHQRHCPRCNNRKLYKLAEGRRRCSRCGYTFHDFSGRFINTGQLDCVQWLWLLFLFELEVPARDIARKLGVAQNTADKALRAVRQAIMANALDAPLFLENKLLQGADPDNPPVFGVMERRGWAFVDIMQGVGPQGLAHFRNRFHLRTAVQGRVVYTDRYRHYDTLVFCAPSEETASLFHSKPGEHGMHVHGKPGFWSFVRERLRRSRGFGARYFPLHLKELELRYNHREDELVSLLARYLCSFVPKPE